MVRILKVLVVVLGVAAGVYACGGGSSSSSSSTDKMTVIGVGS